MKKVNSVRVDTYEHDGHLIDIITDDGIYEAYIHIDGAKYLLSSVFADDHPRKQFLALVEQLIPVYLAERERK